MFVHRQTTERFAMAPHSWDPIPVGYDVLPAEILEDIARWYNDIHDQWREITWWLCRIHCSSSLSAQSILGSSNYVLVLERGYVTFGNRPHGLVELTLTSFRPVYHCGSIGPSFRRFWNLSPTEAISALK